MSRQQRRHAPPPKQRSWTLWIVFGVLLLLVAGGVYYHYSKGTGVDYTQYSYTDDVYAAPNATHVIEEFSDFECPYCQQLAPTIRAVRDTHKEDVRVTYKQFPLRTVHPLAQAAAEASECAREQNKFWAYHDVLFESKKLDKRSLKLHAQGLGLDMDAWNSCIASGRSKAKISQETLEGTQRGVRGTPSIFIDGEAFNGRTVDDFNAALAK
jgi:protein-disulfide isomerase